jgi:hypothetical protein
MRRCVCAVLSMAVAFPALLAAQKPVSPVSLEKAPSAARAAGTGRAVQKAPPLAPIPRVRAPGALTTAQLKLHLQRQGVPLEVETGPRSGHPQRLTPTQLSAGTSKLVLRGVQVLSADRGAPCAIMEQSSRSGGLSGAIELHFDAGAGKRYLIDIAVDGMGAQSLDWSAAADPWTGIYNSPARVPIIDGHAVIVVDAPASRSITLLVRAAGASWGFFSAQLSEI